eukprot:5500823-Ditylum_brightwellii.AAC.1
MYLHYKDQVLNAIWLLQPGGLGGYVGLGGNQPSRHGNPESWDASNDVSNDTPFLQGDLEYVIGGRTLSSSR